MKKQFIYFIVLFLTQNAFSQANGEDAGSLFNAMKSAATAAKKEAFLEEMVRLGGSSSQTVNPLLVEASKQIVVDAYIDEGNLEKAMLWTGRISDERMRNGAETTVANYLIRNGKGREARSILDPKIKPIQKDADGYAVPTGGEAQFAFMYGHLLYAEKDFERAEKFLRAALTLPHAIRYKELYVQNGLEFKQDADLVKEIEQVFLLEGHRTKEFRDAVKDWYIKTDGNDQRFVAISQKAEEAEKARIRAKVEKMALDMPAPDFEVKDMNGNTVSLASLKGKTVILDFWATWCQPCVASFPGMQKAVNHFKDDPDVVFMFIHTMEKKGANAKEEAQTLLKERGYDFDVYLDLKDASIGKSPVADKFQIRAIPAKFVINKEGIIKFSNTGYVGEDEAVEEIRQMVELANSK